MIVLNIENKCVVYLDENYKSFLQKKHKIRSIDKIKILIYVELRLRLFSKYILLEGLRITKRKFSKVKLFLIKFIKMILIVVNYIIMITNSLLWIKYLVVRVKV